MTITTSIGWLNKNMKEAVECPYKIYAYYEESDNIPVSAMQDFIRLGDKVQLVPVSEIGDLSQMKTATLLRAAMSGDTSVFIAVDGDDEDSSITVNDKEFTVRCGRKLPEKAENENETICTDKGFISSPVDSQQEPDAKRKEATANKPVRFGEFLDAIPVKAVPKGVNKAKFAYVLYDIIAHSSCDKVIIDKLEEKYGAMADQSWNILNSTCATAALKNIAWNK